MLRGDPPDPLKPSGTGNPSNAPSGVLDVDHVQGAQAPEDRRASHVKGVAAP
jgi:hypothetical protein